MYKGSGKEATLENIEQDILAMGDILDEAEGIGAFGSLARGELTERSDLDIFVVVRDQDYSDEVHHVWYRRIRKALEAYCREVTVLVYTFMGLRKICNWYVLRLASDGVLFHDKGQVREIFRKILNAAKEAGLVQKKVGGSMVWTTARKLRPGEIIHVEVTD